MHKLIKITSIINIILSVLLLPIIPGILVGTLIGVGAPGGANILQISGLIAIFYIDAFVVSILEIKKRKIK